MNIKAAKNDIGKMEALANLKRATVVAVMASGNERISYAALFQVSQLPMLRSLWEFLWEQ